MVCNVIFTYSDDKELYFSNAIEPDKNHLSPPFLYYDKDDVLRLNWLLRFTNFVTGI